MLTKACTQIPLTVYILTGFACLWLHYHWVQLGLLKLKLNQSQVYAIISPSLCHTHTQPEYNTCRKKKPKKKKGGTVSRYRDFGKKE